MLWNSVLMSPHSYPLSPVRPHFFRQKLQ